MKGDTRCDDGRLMRHDPQPDDPNLETELGKCPDCGGEGCDVLAERDHIERTIIAARAFVKVADEFWPEYPAAIEEYLGALIDVCSEKSL